jgi:hypothetical protein
MPRFGIIAIQALVYRGSSKSEQMLRRHISDEVEELRPLTGWVAGPQEKR